MLSELLLTVLDKPQAGPETARALGYWMREYVIPKAVPTSGKASPSRLGWQSANIVKGLLAQDKLDEVTFGQLVSCLCRIASRSPEQGFGGFNLNGETVIPISYSRHCRPEHVGELVQAIIAQGFQRAGFAAFGETDCLEPVIHSPKFNEGHARALVQWLLPTLEGLGFLQFPRLDALSEITGETFAHKEQFEESCRIYYGKDSGPELAKRVEERVRTWWKEHKEKPLVTQRPAAEFRYIRAEIRVEDEEAKLQILWDVPLQPGLGQVLRKTPQSADYVYICQRLRPGLSDWMGDSEALMPNGVHLFEHTGGGQTNSTTSVYVPGEPEFSGQSIVEDEGEGGRFTIADRTVADTEEEGKPKKKPARTFWATMIVPIKDNVVTADQIASVDFWIERIVRASADRIVRAGKVGGMHWVAIRHTGIGDIGPLVLEEYRTPAVEKQVRNLLQHSEPSVVSTAALILSRWQLEFDAAKVRPMLNSNDTSVVQAAAEALVGVADPEGLRWIMGRMQDPMRVSEAVKLLVKASACPKLDKEAKKRWAAEIIERLLPVDDNPLRPCVLEMVVVKAWTGEDYGYEPGADAAKNRAALKRYHEWAAAAKKGS